MGRVAVEILPPLARDEGGTAFRVKDDRILSQDARARIFDVKTASHRGLSELLVGKPFFRFDLQIPRLAPCVSRWNAGLSSSREARSANGALFSRFMGRRPSPWAALRNASLPSSRGAQSANDALLSRFMGRRPSPWALRRNAGLPSSRGTRSANDALLSQLMGRRPSPWALSRNAGLPSSRGERSANSALFSRFMEQRLSPWAALWSAVSGRFAVAGEARLCPCMLLSASGLRIPRLARGLFTGVFPRPVGRLATNPCEPDGCAPRTEPLGLRGGRVSESRRKEGLPSPWALCRNAGLPSSRGTRSAGGQPFAATVDARRLLPRMLSSESGL